MPKYNLNRPNLNTPFNKKSLIIMSHYTSYGTGNLEIDIENPDKHSSKPCCFFSEKLIYYLFSILVFIALCGYFSYDHFVKSTRDGSTTLSQMKVIVGSKGINDIADPDLTNSDPIMISDSMRNQVINCYSTDEDESCDSKYGCYTFQDDIIAVIEALNDRWDEYAGYVEEQTGLELDYEKGCIGQLLHGKLYCNDECSTKLCMDVTSEKPNLCKNTFLDQMKTTLKPYRRSCISSLIGYQYSQLCEKPKSLSTEIELATFNWWRNTFLVSSSWSHSDCPYYT